MTPMNKNQLLRKIRQIFFWPIEAIFVYVLFAVASILPVSISSAILGLLLQILAPLTPWHQRAKRNLNHAMPELSGVEKLNILKKMWNNLGRVLGEYPHIESLVNKGYVEFYGLQKIEKLQVGGFLIGAHIGNWEIGPLAAINVNKKVAAIYRPLNNPFLASLLSRRQKAYRGDIYKKGREAALGMVSALRKGQMMCLLVDQQLREGINVPFFGHSARTSISHIKIAIKKQVPIFYMRTERLTGCKLRVTISGPINVPKKADEKTILAIATEINEEIENWIRTAPDQWFWPHRRWGKLI